MALGPIVAEDAERNEERQQVAGYCFSLHHRYHREFPSLEKCRRPVRYSYEEAPGMEVLACLDEDGVW